MNARKLLVAVTVSVAVGVMPALGSMPAFAGTQSSTSPVAAAPTRTPPTNKRTLTGHWVSDGCQPSGAGASRASLILDRRASTLALTVYADTVCQAKLFTLEVGSTYQLRGRYPKVEGARLARFSFDSRQITPHVQPIADAMTAAGCGPAPSVVGIATDVFTTGCAPLGQPSAAACPVEYELLKRTSDQLYLGARPADGGGLCTPDRQATTLGAGLVRLPLR